MSRRYSKEFKIETVRLVTDEGYSVAEAAANLGVADESVRRWKLELENAGNKAFAPPDPASEVEQENRKQAGSCLRNAPLYFTKTALLDHQSRLNRVQPVRASQASCIPVPTFPTNLSHETLLSHVFSKIARHRLNNWHASCIHTEQSILRLGDRILQQVDENQLSKISSIGGRRYGV
jgi:transposase-like protein